MDYGKDNAENTTDTIPPQNFVAPVNVIDRSTEAAENPDYLLTVESIQQWEAEHGEIEAGTWVLLRTDWYKRNGSTETFLNADENGPHSPGPTQKPSNIFSPRVLSAGARKPSARMQARQVT